jgi:uncharacterized membrane protein YphA (DoxX/SURF4 family)
MLYGMPQRVVTVRGKSRRGGWYYASKSLQGTEKRMKTFKGDSLDRSWALLFARLILGLIFFMAGVWKVFQLGPAEHARKYFLPYTDTFLPVWSLWGVGIIVPFIELIAGALVILGLRTREALVSLGFVIAIVTFGHLLKEPLYEFHTHVIPRLALLLFILLLPREDDRFSVDYLFIRRRRNTPRR